MEKNWFLKTQINDKSCYLLDPSKPALRGVSDKISSESFPNLWSSNTYVTASEKAQKMGPHWEAVSAATIIEELLTKKDKLQRYDIDAGIDTIIGGWIEEEKNYNGAWVRFEDL